MNPERSSHDNIVLTAQRDTLENAGGVGQLATSRDVYIHAKNQARGFWRNARESFGVMLTRRGTTPTQRMETARVAYENDRNRFIQLQARVDTDASTNEADSSEIFRQRLAENVATQVISEMRKLQTDEIANKRETILDRARGLLQRNPMARMAIGLGLNLAIGASAVTGALPLTMALIGARVGFGAIGMEGAMHGIQNLASKGRGARSEQSATQVGAMNIDEVRRRIASFSESRILERRQGESDTEGRLMNRYAELIRVQVKAKLDNVSPAGAPPVAVENWKRVQAEARNRIGDQDNIRNEAINNSLEQNQNIFNANTETRRRNALINTAEGRINNLDIDKQNAIDGIPNQETIRLNALNQINGSNLVLDERTAGNPIGILRAGIALPALESSCRLILGFDGIINDATGIYTATQKATAQIQKDAEIVNTLEDMLYIGHTPADITRAIDAFRDKTTAETARLNAVTEITRLQNVAHDADQEITRLNNDITNAQTIITNQRTIINTATGEAQRYDHEAYLADQEMTRLRTEANNLTEDQAIMVYDILLGTPAGAPAGRTAPVPAGTGQLASETSNQEKQASMRYERRARGIRGGLAVALSTALTLFTLPETEVINYQTPDNYYGDPNILGNPNVSSLWGQAEAAYMSSHGLDPNIAADVDKFRLILQGPDKESILRGLTNYTNWVRVNSPVGVINGDFINHGVNILRPGNLKAFFDNTGTVNSLVTTLTPNWPSLTSGAMRVI
ncbi:MAG: hypothetical protein Q7R97_02860 [Candidatus Daviesbacteria bacterium]|nr:hypothetical protein [Candidatus Daviesbacteria bacterium]